MCNYSQMLYQMIPFEGRNLLVYTKSLWPLVETQESNELEGEISGQTLKTLPQSLRNQRNKHRELCFFSALHGTLQLCDVCISSLFRHKS